MARRRNDGMEVFPGFRVVARRFVGRFQGCCSLRSSSVAFEAGIHAPSRARRSRWCTRSPSRPRLPQSLFANFVAACTGAVRTTGLILFVIGAAASFGWLLAYLEVPAAAVKLLTGIASDKNVVLLLMIAMPARPR